MALRLPDYKTIRTGNSTTASNYAKHRVVNSTRSTWAGDR